MTAGQGRGCRSLDQDVAIARSLSRHVKRVEITLPGAKGGTADQTRQRAMTLAREIADQPAVRLEALTLGADDRATLLQSRVALKVDVKKQRLAALPVRRPRKAAARRRS